MVFVLVDALRVKKTGCSTVARIAFYVSIIIGILIVYLENVKLI